MIVLLALLMLKAILSSCYIHVLFLQVPSDFNPETVHAAIAEDLERLLSPLGTRDNPAVSCIDISSCRGEQFTPGVCDLQG